MKTFTISFPGFASHDEAPFARIVAELFGTDHTEFAAEPANVELLPQLVRQYDEPIGDHSMVPTYLVSRLVRREAKVALGGDGGDELFGGYTHYSWLLRTCLWGLVWLVIGTFVFAITIIGLLVIFVPWFILTVWYLYRVIRGWLLLNEGKPAPS